MAKLFRSFATVGLWTFLSRILGLLREILLSRAIGASGSPVADAFFTAFRLPNMFRRFLAEGAFNAAFVPMFSRRLSDEEAAHAFAQSAFAGLLGMTGLIVILVQIFTPLFVIILSSGFIGDARFGLAVSYTKITIFYIIFMSLGAMLSGAMNAYGRFSLAAAAPVLLNIVLVVLLGFMLLRPDMPIETRGLWLCWGVFLAGIFQFLLLWTGARRLGLKLRFRLPRWNRDMRDLIVVAIPAMLTNGIAQINLVVGAQIASATQGGQGWLWYADRLYQLPLGVIGIAIGVVLLPSMTALIRENKDREAQGLFNDSIVLAMILTIPAAVLLAILATPIIRVLYEGGQFGTSDTAATAKALVIYAFALPAFVLQKSLFPLFYSREDTRRPVPYAVIDLIINASTALVLSRSIGYLGAAWGSLLAAWAMVAMLWFGSRRYGISGQIAPRTWRMLAGIVAAALVMGAAVWFMASFAQGYLGTGLSGFVAVLALLILAALVYFAALVPLAGLRLSQMRRWIRRG